MYHKEQDTQKLSVEKDKLEKDKGTYVHKYLANALHVHLHNVYMCISRLMVVSCMAK